MTQQDSRQCHGLAGSVCRRYTCNWLLGGKNLGNQRRRYGSNHRSRPYRYLYAAVRDAETPETHHSVRKVGGEASLCKGTLSGCHCNNTGGVHGVHRCIAGTTLLGFPMPLFERLHAMTLFPSTKTPILCSKRQGLASRRATVAFLQITAHASKMQIPHNQIINFYQRAR